MGNKTQLQLNNETLDSILSNVLGLPSQESLKHGAYVWKKINRTISYQSKSVLFYDDYVDDSITSYPITIYTSSSYTFDETTGLYTLNGTITENTVSDTTSINLYNKYATVNSKSSNHMYYTDNSAYGSNTYFKVESLGLRVYIGASSEILTHYYNDCSVVDIFLDFVVSDNEAAYPDAGEQDGYWYEKVKESSYKNFLAERYEVANYEEVEYTPVSNTPYFSAPPFVDTSDTGLSYLYVEVIPKETPVSGNYYMAYAISNLLKVKNTGLQASLYHTAYTYYNQYQTAKRSVDFNSSTQKFYFRVDNSTTCGLMANKTYRLIFAQ